MPRHAGSLFKQHCIRHVYTIKWDRRAKAKSVRWGISSFLPHLFLSQTSKSEAFYLLVFYHLSSSSFSFPCSEYSVLAWTWQGTTPSPQFPSSWPLGGLNKVTVHPVSGWVPKHTSCPGLCCCDMMTSLQCQLEARKWQLWLFFWNFLSPSVLKSAFNCFFSLC